MTAAPPRIGMDRFVDAEWMELAAGVLRGEMNLDGLQARLERDIPGRAVRAKTTGIINRMWFSGDPGARDIALLAADLSSQGGGARAAGFEAVAIANYPYFRQVVEHLGRLLRLQGTCSAGEIHRRMFEQHGKRTTIDQATSYALKTLVSWGLIERRSDQRLAYAGPLELSSSAKSLLDLAANRSRRSVSPLLASDPLLFAFGDQGSIGGHAISIRETNSVRRGAE